MVDQLGHLDGCGGNGWDYCWNCSGEGFYEVADDDMSTMEVRCDVCGGRSIIDCPACEDPRSRHVR